MKVFLTGAGGVMGRAATTALVASGHEVVGLVRSAGSARAVQDRGGVAYQGDLFDRDALVNGMFGCDAVVNYAPSVPIGPGMLRPRLTRGHDRIRTEGAAMVAESARIAKVGRLVQQSISCVYADHGDEWVDERSLIDVSRFAEPVVVSEAHVDAFVRSGRDGVCLRFGIIIGDDPMSVWALRRARTGRPTGIGAPEAWVHVVHPDDVGTATVAALAAPSGVFNVGAEPIRRGDLADVFAHAAGAREGRMYSQVAQRVGGERIEWLARSQRVDSARFRSVTGWDPLHPKAIPEWLDDVA